jgi:hypothetical protein
MLLHFERILGSLIELADGDGESAHTPLGQVLGISEELAAILLGKDSGLPCVGD